MLALSNSRNVVTSICRFLCICLSVFFILFYSGYSWRVELIRFNFFFSIFFLSSNNLHFYPHTELTHPTATTLRKNLCCGFCGEEFFLCNMFFFVNTTNANEGIEGFSQESEIRLRNSLSLLSEFNCNTPLHSHIPPLYKMFK